MWKQILDENGFQTMIKVPVAGGSVDSFAQAKALVTAGVASGPFLIHNNELFAAPTHSTWDGQNWHHSPSIKQN